MLVYFDVLFLLHCLSALILIYRLFSCESTCGSFFAVALGCFCMCICMVYILYMFASVRLAASSYSWFLLYILFLFVYILPLSESDASGCFLFFALGFWRLLLLFAFVASVVVAWFGLLLTFFFLLVVAVRCSLLFPTLYTQPGSCLVPVQRRTTKTTTTIIDHIYCNRFSYNKPQIELGTDPSKTAEKILKTPEIHAIFHPKRLLLVGNDSSFESFGGLTGLKATWNAVVAGP